MLRFTGPPSCAGTSRHFSRRSRTARSFRSGAPGSRIFEDVFSGIRATGWSPAPVLRSSWHPATARPCATPERATDGTSRAQAPSDAKRGRQHTTPGFAFGGGRTEASRVGREGFEVRCSYGTEFEHQRYEGKSTIRLTGGFCKQFSEASGPGRFPRARLFRTIPGIASPGDDTGRYREVTRILDL